MIFKSHRILLFFLPVLSLVVTACNSTPFGGIAVPGMTSVEEEHTEDSNAIYEELKALHVINPSPYEIHPGDTFQISVYNQPSLTTTILITPDGTASLPLIGILKLSGMIDTGRMRAPSFLMVLTAVGDFAYRRPEDGVIVCPISTLKQ